MEFDTYEAACWPLAARTGKTCKGR